MPETAHDWTGTRPERRQVSTGSRSQRETEASPTRSRLSESLLADALDLLGPAAQEHDDALVMADSFGEVHAELCRSGLIIRDHRRGQDPAGRLVHCRRDLVRNLDPLSPLNLGGLRRGTLITQLGQASWYLGFSYKPEKLTLGLYWDDQPTILHGITYTSLHVRTPSHASSNGVSSRRENGKSSVYMDNAASYILADLGQRMKPLLATRAGEIATELGRAEQQDTAARADLARAEAQLKTLSVPESSACDARRSDDTPFAPDP